MLVEIGGEPRALRLERHDVRSRDFRLFVGGEHLTQVEPPPAVTWRGTVGGEEGSVVAASLVRGRLSARVLLRDDVFGIEPTSGPEHLVFRVSDERLPPGTQCAVSAHRSTPVGSGPLANDLRVAELAIDADHDYYRAFGSDVERTHQAVTAIINVVNAIYRRDVQIEHLVSALVVRTSQVYFGGDVVGLLAQFQARWNMNHGAIRRDLAHLFSGKGPLSGVVGYANIGVVCDTSSAYAVSKATIPFGAEILVAHELGHNWGAHHCDAQPPCGIMCSNLGACGNAASFGPAAARAILDFKASRTCLDDPVRTPRFSVFGAGCRGRGTNAASIGSVGLPSIDMSFDVTLANGRPGTSALLLLGASRLVPPVDLAGYGAPGCHLYLQPDLGFATATSGSGAASMTVPIPRNPDLLGGSFFLQWASAEPAPHPGFVTSDAAEARIGTSEPYLPDLVIEGLSVPPLIGLGSSFRISGRVRNRGIAPAFGRTSVAAGLSIDRTPNNGNDIPMGFVDVLLPPAGLLPDQAIDFSWTSFMVPNNALPGRQYLIACVDPWLALRESIEDNNCSDRSVEVRGIDALVTAIAAPSLVRSGEDVDVDVTVRNDSLQMLDIPVNGMFCGIPLTMFVQGVGAQQERTVRFTVRAPGTPLMCGTPMRCTISACAGLAFDTNRANDCSSRPVDVLGAYFDLHVEVQAPASTAPCRNTDWSLRITNGGTHDAVGAIILRTAICLNPGWCCGNLLNGPCLPIWDVPVPLPLGPGRSINVPIVGYGTCNAPPGSLQFVKALVLGDACLAGNFAESSIRF